MYVKRFKKVGTLGTKHFLVILSYTFLNFSRRHFLYFYYQFPPLFKTFKKISFTYTILAKLSKNKSYDTFL